MSKRKKREREKGKPRKRLLTIEKKLMTTRGEVDGGMSEIGEGD